MLLPAISGFPSPFRSPIATELGRLPVTNSTLDANEEVLIMPEVETLRSTDSLWEY